MKAIVFDKSALPTEVLELREVEKPLPGPGEVLVKMLNASINPGDFLFIQSLYPDPKKPSFPGQIAGNSGAGIVVEKGADTDLALNTLVAIYYFDTWAEYAVIPQEYLIPLPPGFPMEKAGQIINLISAWDLIEKSKAKTGEWIAVTAANSTVSVIAIQMASRRGIRVIALLRKNPAGMDLRQLGAEEVIDLSTMNGETVQTRIGKITEGKNLIAIIDSVGGPLLADLIHSTAFTARVILYGGVSEERFELHNFDVLMKGLTIESYIYRNFFTPPAPEDKDMNRQIIEVSGDPSFIVPVGGRYSLEEYKTAIHNSFYYKAGKTSGKNYFIIG